MKIIDLSHAYEEGMTQFPGTPPVRIKQITNIEKDKFTVTDIHATVHDGTHCDAPAHCIKGGKTIDEISFNHFIGEAVIVDVNLDNSKIIGPEVLEGYDVSKNDIVLLRTGYSKFWGKPEYIERAPYLSEKLARKLVKLGIKALGMDFLSPDPIDGDSIHEILLSREIILIENLCNLDKIKKSKVFFSAAPILVNKSDGGFVRAYAHI